MSHVTIQILEGLERGTVLRELETPITIGREDDNLVRLNDERVSRFHAKIQFDGERLILTDLDSTNGTRVNGHPVQIRVLRPGDQIAIGRCLLLVGSPEELRALEAARRGDLERPTRAGLGEQTVTSVPDEESGSGSESDFALDAGSADEAGTLFRDGPPPLPTGLDAGQCAVLSDVLSYVHERTSRIVRLAREQDGDKAGDDGPPMQIDRAAWRQLLSMQMELAVWLRDLADPGADD